MVCSFEFPSASQNSLSISCWCASITWVSLNISNILRCLWDFQCKKNIFGYISKVWFGLVWFYGISTVVDNFMPNTVYTCVVAGWILFGDVIVKWHQSLIDMYIYTHRNSHTCYANITIKHTYRGNISGKQLLYRSACYSLVGTVTSVPLMIHSNCNQHCRLQPTQEFKYT